MKRAYTSFSLGFADKGFNGSEVGIDVVAIYKSKENWTADLDGEKEVGTPIQMDLSNDREIKVCPDGQLPDGYLQLPVKEPYPNEKDFYIQNRDRKFIVAGNPAPFVRNRLGGVLDTKLLVDGYSPNVSDEIYVKDGKFSNVDPLDGEGVSIGTVIEVKPLHGETFAVIALNGGTTDKDYILNEKIKKINITAPSDGTEQDTGFTIPVNAIVKDIKLKVNTSESTGTTKTINIGTTAATDGYLTSVDVSTSGLVKGTLDNAGQTLGDLLTVVSDATNGVKVKEDDVSSGGNNLTFTVGSSDFAELDADIYVYYYDLN
jgi:hypothetical protein